MTEFILTSNLAKNAWKQASMAFKEVGIKTPILDARLLLQHVMDISHEEVISDAEREMDNVQASKFEAVVTRRIGREPIAQILGYKYFWDRKFITTKNTLDPRPDSETLVYAVQQHFTKKNEAHNIIDFGTGTGCLIITLLDEYPNAKGMAVDISEEALNIARKNAKNNGVAKRLQTLRADWGHDIVGRYDIIISNPPYIPKDDIDGLEEEVKAFDPMLALDGGKDGLNQYRALMPHIGRMLSPNGRAFIEIGAGQEAQVEEIAANQNLELEKSVKDFAGIVRCLVFKLA